MNGSTPGQVLVMSLYFNEPIHPVFLIFISTKEKKNIQKKEKLLDSHLKNLAY